MSRKAEMFAMEMAKVEAAKKDLDARIQRLFKSGCLVRLHIQCWMGDAGIEREDILNDSPVLSVYGEHDGAAESGGPPVVDPLSGIPVKNYGRKYLVPPKSIIKVHRAATNARRWLAENSFNFTMLPGVYFVPLQNLPVVLKQLDKYKLEFEKEAESFVGKYLKLKRDMMSQYPALKDAVYPTVPEVRTKFRFTVLQFEMSLPNSIRRLKLETLAASQSLRKMQAQYRTRLMQEYNEGLQDAREFIRSVMIRCREPIVRSMTVILQKLTEGEIVAPSTLGKAKALIKTFKELDFLGDTTFSTQLDELHRLLSSGHDFSISGPAIEELQTTVKATLEVAGNLSDIDQLTGGHYRVLG